MTVVQSRKHTAPDPFAEGLAEIAAWREWFVDAHKQRLVENGTTGAAFDSELAYIVSVADAIAERRRSDFLARRG